MDEKDLRSLYLRDMSRASGVRTAIRRAAKQPDRTLALRFARFDDDPMLLYAAWGLARLEGVTLVLPPGR